MKSLAIAAVLALSSVALVRAADQAPASPQERILAARSSLRIADGHLTGAGANTLLQAARSADFVLLGEDHGTSEIPRLSDALFSDLATHGFDTIAMETGPLAAAKLRAWAASPSGAAEYAAFERAHPGTIAFYGWSGEFTFLRDAVNATHGTVAFWGLDQELMGSPGFILESILAQHPGPTSTALARSLLQKNDADYAEAGKTGNPGVMFLMVTPPGPILALANSLESDGNPRAQSLARSLVDTQRIYINCCNDKSEQSNRDRAILMKQTLAAYRAESSASGRKIFFKFGLEHLYRGFNPLHNNDLGNDIAEISDVAGKRDVRILVLPVSGSQSAFAGIGKPWASAPIDPNDDQHARLFGTFLKPFVEAMYPSGMTLYDLSAFRTNFQAMNVPDADFERLVFGYDYLVLVPNATADPAIDPLVF